MKSQNEIEVREFITNFFKNKYNKGDFSISDDLDFFSSGLLSSLDFIDLITSIEKKFSYEFDFDNADPSEYSTVQGVIKSICKESK